MRTWFPAVLISTAVLASMAFADERVAPPHPTLLLVEYHGKTYPVISVEKEDPVILVDGKRQRLRNTVPLSTERANRYAGPKAQMTNQRTEVLQLLNAPSELDVDKVKNNPGTTLGGYVEFSATITAAENLSECYVALFAFDVGFLVGQHDKPNAQLRVRRIPDLVQGQPTAVKFSSSPFLSSKRVKVFALLFSGDHEVSTNVSPDAWRYFDRRERVVHAAAVRQWLKENSGQSKPLRPMLQIPPLFESTEGFPPNATATLIVAPDGTVSHVGVDGFDRTAEDVLRTTLSAWLFMPALKDGMPIESRVSVPLRF